MTLQLFDVLRTVEFDIELGEEHFRVRVQTSRSRARPVRYRVDVAQLEFYRLRPSFGPKIADEKVWVDWSAILRGFDAPFRARSAADAERKVLREIEAWIAHSMARCSDEPHVWRDCPGA